MLFLHKTGNHDIKALKATKTPTLGTSIFRDNSSSQYSSAQHADST